MQHLFKACFRAWHGYVVGQRANLNRALGHRRSVMLSKVRGAWQKISDEMHEVRNAGWLLYLKRD